MEMQSFTCTGSFVGMGFWHGFVGIMGFRRGFVVALWLWVCGESVAVGLRGKGFRL